MSRLSETRRHGGKAKAERQRAGRRRIDPDGLLSPNPWSEETRPVKRAAAELRFLLVGTQGQWQLAGTMHEMKQFLLFLVGGMPVGATLASFIAPPIVKLTHAPAGEMSALCNCNTLADNMIGALFQAQLIGLGVGAALGVVAFVLLKRSGRLGGRARPSES